MKNYLLIILVLIGVSCKEKDKENVYEKAVSPKIANTTNTPNKGKKYLEQQCFVCHNPKASFDNRIAPPFIAIKAHYIKANTTKEDFIQAFVNFVQNPTDEKAKLKGAIKRFGLMPKQAFKTADLEQMAAYIYDYKIDEPTWFKTHWEEKGKPPYINTGKITEVNKQSKTKAEIGLEYALGIKKVLGKHLMGTIQKSGTHAALSFCNENAYALTDSMAVKYNATIKRVSDQPRNNKNTANKDELLIIKAYKDKLSQQKDLESIIVDNDEGTQFYYPIKTNTMCLQCHGVPQKDIKPVVLTKLLSLYPDDKAQNYKENQIRGIWSITFNN